MLKSLRLERPAAGPRSAPWRAADTSSGSGPWQWGSKWSRSTASRAGRGVRCQASQRDAGSHREEDPRVRYRSRSASDPSRRLLRQRASSAEVLREFVGQIAREDARHRALHVVLRADMSDIDPTRRPTTRCARSPRVSPSFGRPTEPALTKRMPSPPASTARGCDRSTTSPSVAPSFAAILRAKSSERLSSQYKVLRVGAPWTSRSFGPDGVRRLDGGRCGTAGLEAAPSFPHSPASESSRSSRAQEPPEQGSQRGIRSARRPSPRSSRSSLPPPEFRPRPPRDDFVWPGRVSHQVAQVVCRVHATTRDLGEHGLERGQIPVDVGQERAVPGRQHRGAFVRRIESTSFRRQFFEPAPRLVQGARPEGVVDPPSSSPVGHQAGVLERPEVERE